jgi:hypothetical protein
MTKGTIMVGTGTVHYSSLQYLIAISDSVEVDIVVVVAIK